MLIALVATPLLFQPQNIASIQGLPTIHKDPFDRVLIAQASVEGLALISADSQIAQYATQKIKIIR